MVNRISIVGMGALGILFGELLHKCYGKDVVKYIVNEERKNRYQVSPITCNGEVCDFGFISEEEDGPSDLVIFAVKATALEEAIHSARNQIGENTIIISLLNGVSSEEIIGNSYGMKGIIYSVAQGMDAVRVGSQLNYSKRGQICFGVPNEEKEEKSLHMNKLIEIFDQAGVPYTVESDIKHRIWSKFMLNVGVNQITTITEGNYDTVQQEGEYRELMKNAMREVIAIAKYKGITLTEVDLEYYVGLVDSLSKEGMPSMRQDALSSRKTEVDLFAGTVIQLGKLYGVSTPINDMIYIKIKEIESKY